MKVRIPRESRRPVNLYLPVFIVWLLLFAICLLLLPFLLIGAVFTWQAGHGKIMIFSIPMLFCVLWHLHGVLIDVESENEKIYLEFI
jgi:hypothetical protein